MEDNYEIESFELIEKYLNNELDKSEKAEVEERLKNDVSFKETFKWYKEMNSSLPSITAKDAKAQAKGWLLQDRAKHEQLLKKGSNTKWLILGLLVLLGLCALLYFFKANPPKVDPIQYADTLLEQPYKSPIILRNNSNDEWSKLIPLYKTKKYPEFIVRLKPRILDQSATNEQVFYYALSHLYVNPINCNLPIPLFTQLIQSKTGFEDQALWFRSLAHLKCNDEETAKQDLQQVINKGNFKVKEAKQLLSNLE